MSAARSKGQVSEPEDKYRCFLNRELSWLSFNERVLEELFNRLL